MTLFSSTLNSAALGNSTVPIPAVIVSSKVRRFAVRRNRAHHAANHAACADGTGTVLFCCEAVGDVYSTEVEDARDDANSPAAADRAVSSGGTRRRCSVDRLR